MRLVIRCQTSGRSLTATSNVKTPISNAQNTQRLSLIPSPASPQNLPSCRTGVSLLPTPPCLGAFAHTLPSVRVSSSPPDESSCGLQSPAPMLLFLGSLLDLSALNTWPLKTASLQTHAGCQPSASGCLQPIIRGYVSPCVDGGLPGGSHRLTPLRGTRDLEAVCTGGCQFLS